MRKLILSIMLTAALPLHVGAQTLFFDDQQGPDAATNWVVKELKDFEVGPPAMQGSLKVEYIKKPVPTIATRQGSKVIGTTSPPYGGGVAGCRRQP